MFSLYGIRALFANSSFLISAGGTVAVPVEGFFFCYCSALSSPSPFVVVSAYTLIRFLLDMNLAYSAADLVVACSGAITCSELLNLGKPSILIPLQYVADNHQRNNAAVLERAGAARILDDVGLTPEKLEGAINELLGDKAILASMCKNALKIATPSAADLIAQEHAICNLGSLVVACAKMIYKDQNYALSISSFSLEAVM
ncbi:hypothetical protein GOP47_0018078 [Adiantum capillus-veneris]|uniref:Glycosyl transferase family 28 C-terminal domain-containing protein n=1 Tax=Adiantum capillus-veneris TaxID=13818 RepID=A0A9D4UGP1_ADICA|nr:hypothetical protein GOP47_0018078 [Adiantum capillus-veneris]